MVSLSRKFGSTIFSFPSTRYIPDAQEIEDSEFYQADATADRLERRFGHPSLHEKLISPMLHKSVEHLLPLVSVFCLLAQNLLVTNRFVFA